MTHSHKPKQDAIAGINEFKGVAKNRLALAMVVTAAVMVLELVGSVLTGSLALGSDAGHMFTHLFALVISFIAIVFAQKEPCHHRTYGFYRMEILAALINSLFLFAVTGYIVYEAVVRLLNPQPILGIEMFIVALFGLAANGVSILLLRGHAEHDLNIKGAFLHMFADTASSVAIIIAAVIVYFTGWYFIDPLIGLGISVLILLWAWRLFRDSVNVLLESAPKGMNTDEIAEEIKKLIPQIIDITDIHIWEITSNMYSFTAHIKLPAKDAATCQRIIEDINWMLDNKYGVQHTTIQLDYAE